MSLPRLRKWSERRTDAESTLVKYRRTTAAETGFVVSLHRWTSASEEYEIRLSVITPAEAQVRRGYPVADHEKEDRAFDAFHSFVRYTSEQLEKGQISKDDPADQEVQALIRDFDGEASLPSLRRFVGKFQR